MTTRTAAVGAGAEPVSVEAWMNFAGDIQGRARVDVPDWARTNLVLDKHDLRIRDARPRLDELSLDREGFTLVRHEAGLTPSCDLAAEATAYLTSVGELLQRISGADLVLPQSNGLLKRHSERAKLEGSIGPSRWVHMDYTRACADKWIGWMEGWQGRRLRHYPRVAIYQTWRCVSPPPQDNTLALCDASTIRAETCIPFDACIAMPYEDPGNQFESQLSTYDSGQRWFYFPNLRTDEMIVFKGYDSDPSRDAQPLHNSIDVPGAPADAVPRVSIEARFFAFFDR